MVKTYESEGSADALDRLPSRKDVDPEACCVAFSLRESGLIEASELRTFHSELQACVELFGATIVELAATNGVLRCEEGAGEAVSAADAAVRLGQLLCRWASDREQPFSLRVGVHVGSIRTLQLANNVGMGYYGSAVSKARRLAETAPDHWVHFLKPTKERLSLFEGLPLTRAAAKDTYYLEPWVEQNSACNPRSSTGSQEVTLTGAPPRDKSRDSQCVKTAAASGTLEEFTQMLVDRGVDVTKFGKGHAKTVQDFHKEIVETRKAYLVDTEDGQLERRLELVRISLCATDSQGQDRTLMVAMEIMEDGRTRQRNQKLAASVCESSGWEESVKRCFLDRFFISEQLQKELFSLEMNWYKEEKLSSPSIPGITTRYLTHEVRMRVVDPLRPELQALGLPSMQPFATTESGSRKMSWVWACKGEDLTTNEDALTQLLRDHNINTSEFEAGAFAQLLDEYEKKTSVLRVVRAGEIVRDLQIVKVWVSFEVLSVPHVLVIQQKVQRGKLDASQKDRPISMRMKGMSWEEAARLALRQRLGLDEAFMRDKLFIDPGTYRLREETEYSPSYPGLKTVYCIHEVTCRVREPHPQLGLPDGIDFAFSRVEKSKDGKGSTCDDIVVTYFTWKQPKEFQAGVAFQRLGSTSKGAPEKGEVEPDPKRRVTSPKLLVIDPVTLARSDPDAPVIATLMRGKSTNWARARNAAKRIRDKDYHCGLFFDDCSAAFPELQLYVAGPQGATTTMSSGRSPDDEYQRTIGALFAVYWMMRSDLDGAQSFAFGVDSATWLPLGADSASPRRKKDEIAKRTAFRDNVQWHLFKEVLVASGLLSATGAHDEERTLAMLVLTAIHDVMKVSALLPRVAGGHGDWCGYKPGEEVNDHDAALGYILEFLPDALPSFAGLPAAQRESVKFTQCKMEYNMGWLVQAEAPPGALFRTFKTIVEAGKAKSQDIAFYFTHWLTDLAGAEPCPQEGCEKFVLKFPQKVLVAFLHSFPYVNKLNVQTETQVLEEYLQWRWSTTGDESGPAPRGPGSVARLRVVIMAQGHQQMFLDAYRDLAPADRQILDVELARTGCRGQAFERDKLEGAFPERGPAFLVYYGPALLQKNASDPASALQVLAEVLRQARKLWPLEESHGHDTVTVRIDALKELTVTAMQALKPGEFWALQRLGGRDAQVHCLSMLAPDGSPLRVDWRSHRLLAIGGTWASPEDDEGPGPGPTSFPTSLLDTVGAESSREAPVLDDPSPESCVLCSHPRWCSIS